MDSPLEAMLKNPAVDMPFCLTWANENWTRAWDGAENDVLIAQEHSASDSRAFIFHLLRYFEDERYIKIEGKPVLCVYRVDIIPDILETVALWREEMRNAGFPGIYLICAQTFGVVSPLGFDFDAAMEFPPHTIKSAEYQRHYEFTNCDFQGKIYNYDEVVRNSISSDEPEFKFFRTAMLAWDNTARKQNNPHIFEHFSLLRYKQWLSHLANRIYNNSKYVADEKIVFVNAWNEWAEGTHLEPDRKYGYGYLQSTYDVIANYDRNVVGDLISSDKLGTLNNKYAVIVHIHYQDLWPEIRDIVRNIQAFGCDIYVSTTDSKMINEIRHSFPNACITIVENRGRDILPFLSVFDEAYTLGYRAVCKLHSKQSSYREDGNEIRKVLFDRLAGSESCVEEILSRFDSDPKLGILVPTGYLIPHTDHNMTYDKELVKELEGLLNFEFHYSAFPAGSMFWFRPEALASVRSIKNDVFPVEDGLADGTMAHAMERSFCVLATSAGFSVDSC